MVVTGVGGGIGVVHIGDSSMSPRLTEVVPFFSLRLFPLLDLMTLPAEEEEEEQEKEE